jgi:hypothetical protein
MLPLSRENINAYLSTILSLYSIKTQTFFNDFINNFNQKTQFYCASDFTKFLQNDITFLSYTNITVPIILYILDVEKGEYKLEILVPTFCNLRAYYLLNLNTRYDLSRFQPHIMDLLFLLFLYRTFSIFHIIKAPVLPCLILLMYKKFRYTRLIQARSRHGSVKTRRFKNKRFFR